jgi:hypothetical protein
VGARAILSLPADLLGLGCPDPSEMMKALRRLLGVVMDIAVFVVMLIRR